MDLEKAIKKGFIKRIEPAEDLVQKELSEAKYDFSKARTAFEEEDFKWCIVKSYYATFHASKALMFKFGYKEGGHFTVEIFLEHLSKEGKLESKYLYLFSSIMDAREDADYRYKYSREIAQGVLDDVEEFLEKIERLLKQS